MGGGGEKSFPGVGKSKCRGSAAQELGRFEKLGRHLGWTAVIEGCGGRAMGPRSEGPRPCGTPRCLAFIKPAIGSHLRVL